MTPPCMEVGPIESLEEAQVDFASFSRTPRFPLIAFNKVLLSSASTYAIKGVLPKTGLTVVYGPYKTGKSYHTLDMVLHVALGWPYRGRRVRQGSVVYCALEGVEGFRARIEAFRQNRLDALEGGVPFHLMATPLDLIRDVAALISDIQAELGEQPPTIVVVDTLNRSLAGSESDDRDMSAYIRAADAIRDAFGCAVVVVHHSGLDSSRPRGHTSLTAAADAQISIKRDGENIVATVEYMKDGPAGDVIVSHLKQVVVGMDDDGDLITSCIVEAVETPPTEPKISRPRLTKGAQIALGALHDALNDCGEIPPASNHIPSHTLAVTLTQWRDFAYRRGISASDKPDASRVAFARASECLVAARQVAIWDLHVWAMS